MTTTYQKGRTDIATKIPAEDNGVWTLADTDNSGMLDLVYIKTRNTGSTFIEVHIASHSGNYQDWTRHIATTCPQEENGTWLMKDVTGDGKADLVYIKTRGQTSTDRVEVWAWTAASGYQQCIWGTPTTFVKEECGEWTLADMNGSGPPDLVFIKTSQTPNNMTEVHVASAASGFQTRILETATKYVAETDGHWQMCWSWANIGQILVYIKTRNTPGNKVEVHTSARLHNFSNRSLESSSCLTANSDGPWFVANVDMNDGYWADNWNDSPFPELINIRHRNTTSGMVEISYVGGINTQAQSWFDSALLGLSGSQEKSQGGMGNPMWTPPVHSHSKTEALNHGFLR